MDNENKPKSRFSRFVDKLFARPAVKIAVYMALAVISVALFVIFGTNPDKNLTLTRLPVLVVIEFLAVYFIFWVQKKNPYCSSRGLDVFELIFFAAFALGAVGFGICFALNIRRSFYETLPGMLVCLCSLTLFHSRRDGK